MSYKNIFLSEKPTCVGIGLIALDVVFNELSNVPLGFYGGGSCGNVMTILSFLGWSTHPVARLRNNDAARILVNDLERFGVNCSLVFREEDGSTPIIIHRVLKDRKGASKHRFEFRDPETGVYLPSYKPVLASRVDLICQDLSAPNVFYLDRVNRASVDMAKKFQGQNSLVFFEPSSYKEDKIFFECLSLADVLKFSGERISDYQERFPICERKLEIMTIGAEGLIYRLQGQKEWTHLASFEIGSVVDAAGSGDWCTSGFIYSFFYSDATSVEFNRKSVEDSLRFGQALAALNCCFYGARGAMYAMDKESLLEAAKGLFNLNERVDQFCHGFYKLTDNVFPVETRLSTLY